jgi:hypothetical protein
MPQTRRRSRSRKQRGGIFGFGGPSKQNVASRAAYDSLQEAQSKAAYNMAHSKSRVANLGLSMANKTNGSFGELRYTNKERIQEELDDKIDEIAAVLDISLQELMSGAAASSTTNPAEVTSIIKDLKTSIEQQLAATAPTAAAITLTIPIGLAQLLVKVFRVLLAFVVFCIGLMSASVMTTNISGAVSTVLPNMKFNTTKNSFSYLKTYFQGRKSV